MRNRNTIVSKIKKTNTYQELSGIQQIFLLNRNNVERIKHALTVISNIGFEKWDEISNYNLNNFNLIKELNETAN